MEAEKFYKYLEIKQTQQINQQTMKQELTNECLARITCVLKFNLNSKNTFKAFNTYKLSYSLGIIK